QMVPEGLDDEGAVPLAPVAVEVLARHSGLAGQQGDELDPSGATCAWHRNIRPLGAYTTGRLAFITHRGDIPRLGSTSTSSILRALPVLGTKYPSRAHVTTARRSSLPIAGASLDLPPNGSKISAPSLGSARSWQLT